MSEVQALLLLAHMFGTYVCGQTATMVDLMQDHGVPDHWHVYTSPVDESFIDGVTMLWYTSDDKTKADQYFVRHMGEHMGCEISFKHIDNKVTK